MAYKKTVKEDEKKESTCGCDEGCNCHKEDHECNCEHEHGECHCADCDCESHNISSVDLANEYLNMARIIQADFDNYRKRSIESIRQAKIDGIVSAVEVILPSLDIFKKAKQMIKDTNALKGVEMVESEIYNSLETLGVEKIETKDCKFNPNLHNALAVVEDNTKPDGVIIEEYQAGYKMGEKVIKYSQVIVNKLKEEK